MKQRLLVFLYFALAGFFVYVLLIVLALSAMDRGSDHWNIEAWLTVLTPIALASLFVALGIRQHIRYAKKQFKKFAPSKPHVNLFRVLNVCIVTLSGFCILWGLALLIEKIDMLSAMSSLFIGFALIYASVVIHKKFVK